MYRITSKMKHDLPIDKVMALYEDVGWISYLKDEEKMNNAIEHSLYVVTAWHEDELVGLLRVIGDGETILYVQDILVKVAYQRKGIGRKMMEKMLQTFPHVRQKVLMTEVNDLTRAFFMEVGFMPCDGEDLIGYTRFD